MPNYSGLWTKTQQMQAQGASNWPAPPILPGQQAYTTAGTYTWIAPATVTEVSVVAVGGGGAAGGFSGNGGGGGGLAYKNNITVVPGNSYTVVVGAGSFDTQGGSGCGAGPSSFNSIFTAGAGRSGRGAGYCGGAPSGCYTGGGTGGAGGNLGGGGAGGYSGNGGNGSACCAASGAGAGGGASGGGANAGGGVGILGQGASGASVTNAPGKGGSGGGDGTTRPGGSSTRSGGNYGGAGYWNGAGAGGAVRIIWGTTVTRAFPSTNTGDL